MNIPWKIEMQRHNMYISFKSFWHKMHKTKSWNPTGHFMKVCTPGRTLNQINAKKMFLLKYIFYLLSNFWWWPTMYHYLEWIRKNIILKCKSITRMISKIQVLECWLLSTIYILTKQFKSRPSENFTADFCTFRWRISTWSRL